MPRNSSWSATRYLSSLRVHAVLAGVLVAAMVTACKSREQVPAIPSPPPPVETKAAPRAEPAAFHLPPEHTFDLSDDAPVDPAEELRAMTHDCCDEMPASEIEAATRADEATANTPTPRRRKHARSAVAGIRSSASSK